MIPSAKQHDRFKRWIAFAVGDVDGLPLRIFEILFTASYLVWIGRCLLTWQEWLTNSGFHLEARELVKLGYPEPFELLTWPGVVCLTALICLSAVAHIFNHFRKLALVVLLGTALYVQGVDFMAAFTLNKLYVGVYGVLLIAPGYRRDPITQQLVVSALAPRIIQTTLILQYFAAGLAKAFRGDWLNYADVLYTQVQGVYRTDIAAWCLRHLPVWSWTVMQWISLLFELEAPVLFCVRRLRLLAILLGLGFHFLVAILMKDLIYFSLQMAAFYVLFVSGGEWRDLAKRSKAVWTSLEAALPLRLGADRTELNAKKAPYSGQLDEKRVQRNFAVNISLYGRKPHPRRVFLMGAGATVALPILISVSDRFLRGHKGVQSLPERKSDQPKRLVCVGNAFGFYPPAFWPQTPGRNYEMPRLLGPLAQHKEEFTIFAGLDHGHKGGHWAVNSYLSGVRAVEAKFLPERNITIDQRAAETIGGATRFPSLAVGSVGGLVGGCMMSWTRDGARVPPISTPSELFNKLFVVEGQSALKRAQEHFQLQESILDAVHENAKTLVRRLGKVEAEKIDEYFTSIREVEKQLELRQRWVDIPKPNPGMSAPEDSGFVSDLPIFYDLIALALETDSTRIATLEIAGGFHASELGVKRDYHALSHHGQVEENIRGLLTLETYQIEQFARFLARLKSIRLAGDPLLNHCMVLFGSGMANANAHTNINLPIILAGGGFQHGEYRAYPKTGSGRQDLCSLYVSILQRFGVETDRFGNATHTLTGFN